MQSLAECMADLLEFCFPEKQNGKEFGGQVTC